MSVSKARDFGISYSSQNPLRVPSETRQPSQKDFFQHAALEDDKKFIRLVQILPDLTDNGLIQLSLRDFLFDSRDQVDGTHTSRVAPTYSCLSYTWGVRSKDMTIHLNEKPFQIRRNLWQYLAEVRTQIANHGELRRPDVERYTHSERLGFLANPLTNCNLFLWIDALCIDQTNDTEKGHQVQWMGEIYANADMVMIWLGITGYDESVLQTKVQKPPRTDWQEGGFLLKMITSDYWSRAWITQELLLAICPVFLTQSGLHSFGTVGKLLQPDSIANPRLDVLSLLDTYATPPGTHKSSDIVSLLHRLNGSKKKCMNVLDRVYSLLALSEHGHKIEVDYTISSTELASRVLLAS